MWYEKLFHLLPFHKMQPWQSHELDGDIIRYRHCDTLGCDWTEVK